MTIVNGQVRSGFSPLSVALGLVALPAVLLAWQWLRGCEVLAVLNWLLRRDDQIGCLVLSPIDHLERGAGVVSSKP